MDPIDYLMYSMWTESLRKDSMEALDNANRTDLLVAALERRLACLTQVTEALWSVVKQQTGCTDEQLMNTVKHLAQKNGQGGGAPALTCKKCGRVVTKSAGRCLYCGATAEPTTPFQGI